MQIIDFVANLLHACGDAASYVRNHCNDKLKCEPRAIWPARTCSAIVTPSDARFYAGSGEGAHSRLLCPPCIAEREPERNIVTPHASGGAWTAHSREPR